MYIYNRYMYILHIFNGIYLCIYIYAHMLYNIDTSHLLTKIPFNKLRNTFTYHTA